MLAWIVCFAAIHPDFHLSPAGLSISAVISSPQAAFDKHIPVFVCQQCLRNFTLRAQRHRLFILDASSDRTKLRPVGDQFCDNGQTSIGCPALAQAFQSS
jgi:hypothetical protein